MLQGAWDLAVVGRYSALAALVLCLLALVLVLLRKVAPMLCQQPALCTAFLNQASYEHLQRGNHGNGCMTLACVAKTSLDCDFDRQAANMCLCRKLGFSCPCGTGLILSSALQTTCCRQRAWSSKQRRPQV